MTAAARLILAGRALVDAGLSPGSSGNLSVRDDARILMTGTGTRLGALTVDDLAVLDTSGAVLEGPTPSKEVSLHLALYAKNPGDTAVVHVHSPFAVALSCLPPWAENSAVPPLTPYVLMKLGQTPLLPFVAPGDAAMGDLITESPYPFRGALLANHGAVVSGADAESAVAAAIELEEACRIAMLTLGTDRRLIPAEQIAAITARSGTPWTGAAVLG
jgi:L-fuculose-phosphate aldolase